MIETAITLLVGFIIGYFSKGITIKTGEELPETGEYNQSFMVPDPEVREYYDDLIRKGG